MDEEYVHFLFDAIALTDGPAVTIVNPSWLAQLGPTLCTFSKPLPVPPTMKDLKKDEVLVVPKFGPGWELPPVRRMKDQK